jgi:hypothetical protein
MCTDNYDYFFDQNVMCMRSGLVIKTTPAARSASSRSQAEISHNSQWLSAVCGSSINQHQSFLCTDGSDPTVSVESNSGTKNNLKPVPRYRSINYLSIVTRFYMMQRMRDSDIEITTSTQSPENMYWLQIDECVDNNGRYVNNSTHIRICSSQFLKVRAL